MDSVPTSESMLVADLIWCAHLCVIAFVVFVPFFGTDNLLAIHSFAVPGMMLHWITNSQRCFLTILESKLRGFPETDNRLFLHRLVSPVYSVNHHEYHQYIYVVTVALWCVTILRLRASNFAVFREMQSLIATWFGLLVRRLS